MVRWNKSLVDLEVDFGVTMVWRWPITAGDTTVVSTLCWGRVTGPHQLNMMMTGTGVKETG
jgi:hypothetical protein